MRTVSPAMSEPVLATADDEAALFLAWRSHGDQQALTELVDRLTPQLWSLARRIAGHDADAEDALQHGLLQVIQRAHTFTGRGSCRGWILAVVANAARHQRRDAQRRRQAETRAAAQHPTSTESPSGDAGAAGERLLAALDALPEHERVAVSLHLIEGWAQAEVAAALGCSPNTVSSQVRRGLARLEAHARRDGLAVLGGACAVFLASVQAPTPAQLPERLRRLVAHAVASPRGAIPLMPLLVVVAGLLALWASAMWILGTARANAAQQAGGGLRRSPSLPRTLPCRAPSMPRWPCRCASPLRRMPSPCATLRSLNSRLPPGTFIPCGYPNEYHPEGDPTITWSTGVQAQRVRVVIDAIATQTGYRWQAMNGEILLQCGCCRRRHSGDGR